ncbi:MULTISPECIES: hypothetical protein [unclassified Cryobacterium]|uniref:hypothetical protein n=1 Tax=unclassified Cryobacterium TaxID=2649013 RepID=UPI00106AB383|nr:MULTISPECIES: hypothetical protein [unclassified Cryobacterium]TFD16850.1 hypothetical protein E3T32_14690 [Cryobacterium sp. TMT2-23]TFD19950.1 hypothetical protein E3T42_03065 [Cryobacterium sp. TMT4-10]
MSDNLARAPRPNWATEPAAAVEERRHIEIVSSSSQRRARPKIVYALSAVTGVSLIVLAQLLLSVGISQSAYEVSRLQASQVELGRTAESVTEDLVRSSSPQSLAANAEALGMVSNSNPVYLRLSDGAVLGAPASAAGSQGGAASLVPNSLLAGVPLVTQLPQGSGQGASVGGSVAPAAAPAAAPVASTATPNGLPTPATR